MFGDKTKESIDDDSQAFKELTDAAVYLITTKVPVIERPVILRNQACGRRTPGLRIPKCIGTDVMMLYFGKNLNILVYSEF